MSVLPEFLTLFFMAPTILLGLSALLVLAYEFWR